MSQTPSVTHSTVHWCGILASAFQSLHARQGQRLEHPHQLQFYKTRDFKITSFQQKQHWKPRGQSELLGGELSPTCWQPC